MNLKPSTICWDCKKAGYGNVSECPWEREFKPVDGWNAIYSDELDSYAVISCPLFERDERLPKQAEYTCQCGATVIGKRTCPDCLAKKKEYMRQRKIELRNKKDPVFKFSDNTCDAARIALQARYGEYKNLSGKARIAMRYRICIKAGCCRCGGKKMAGQKACKRCYEREQERYAKKKELKTNG